MIANIPLATGTTLNSFTSDGEMLSIMLHCALVLFFLVYLVHLINHLLKKKIINCWLIWWLVTTKAQFCSQLTK